MIGERGLGEAGSSRQVMNKERGEEHIVVQSRKDEMNPRRIKRRDKQKIRSGVDRVAVSRILLLRRRIRTV